MCGLKDSVYEERVGKSTNTECDLKLGCLCKFRSSSAKGKINVI